MKLATILAASVAANNERHFSTDKYSVASSVDDWWYSGPKVPANQMAKMRSTTSKFFDAYFPGKRVRGRFGKKWQTLQNDMESAAEDCTFAAKGGNRQRRSTGQEERFMNAFVTGDYVANNVRTDFWAFSEGHARWIVKEVQEECPVKAQRLLRRVDRLRWAMNWRYCKNYDDDFGLPVTSEATQEQDPVGFCWWAYFNWKGEAKDHPRLSNPNFQPGGIYSVDGPQ